MRVLVCFHPEIRISGWKLTVYNTKNLFVSSAFGRRWRTMAPGLGLFLDPLGVIWGGYFLINPPWKTTADSKKKEPYGDVPRRFLSGLHQEK
jgi:hypothetical protein